MTTKNPTKGSIEAPYSPCNLARLCQCAFFLRSERCI